MSLRIQNNRLGWFVIAAGCAAAIGCSEELGPEVMRTTQVRGVVRQGETPVRGGWIEFIPDEGTVGVQRSAPIGADGAFSIDRAPVGPVAIRLLDVPITAPFPIEPRAARRTFGSFPPAIRRVIPDQPTVLDLELIEELIAHRARIDSIEARKTGAAP